MSERKIFGAWNEWGKLREAALGYVDDLAEPEYIPELVWVSEEGKEALRNKPGWLTREAFPEIAKKINYTLDRLEHVLREHGVTVHRTRPIPDGFDEEKEYLKSVQKGSYTIGGADFFRVLGTRVLLLNSFHLPFRRSNIWSVRRMLEPLLEDSNATYIATPPPSPHYTRDDLYLENGDIMVDGHNVYVGMSGNATSPKGVAWLKQLLGDDYRVHTIRLQPYLFHLDWLLSLNRPGLLTYCPEAFIDPLPEPLKKWDKIEIGPDEVAGANNLSINENTIIVASTIHELRKPIQRRGCTLSLSRQRRRSITVPGRDALQPFFDAIRRGQYYS